MFLQYFGEEFVRQFQQHLDQARQGGEGVHGAIGAGVGQGRKELILTTATETADEVTMPENLHSTVYPARTLVEGGYKTGAASSSITATNPSGDKFNPGSGGAASSIITPTTAVVTSISRSENTESVQQEALRDAVQAMKALWSEVDAQDKVPCYDRAKVPAPEEAGAEFAASAAQQEENEETGAEGVGVFDYSYLDYFDQLREQQEGRVDQALSTYIRPNQKPQDSNAAPSVRYKQSICAAEHREYRDDVARRGRVGIDKEEEAEEETELVTQDLKRKLDRAYKRQTLRSPSPSPAAQPVTAATAGRLHAIAEGLNEAIHTLYSSTDPAAAVAAAVQDTASELSPRRPTNPSTASPPRAVSPSTAARAAGLQEDIVARNGAYVPVERTGGTDIAQKGEDDEGEPLDNTQALSAGAQIPQYMTFLKLWEKQKTSVAKKNSNKRGKRKAKKSQVGRNKAPNMPLYRNTAATGYPDALKKDAFGRATRASASMTKRQDVVEASPGVRAELEAAAMADTNARMEIKRLETVQEELWKSSLERIEKGKMGTGAAYETQTEASYSIAHTQQTEEVSPRKVLTEGLTQSLSKGQDGALVVPLPAQGLASDVDRAAEKVAATIDIVDLFAGTDTAKSSGFIPRSIEGEIGVDRPASSSHGHNVTVLERVKAIASPEKRPQPQEGGDPAVIFFPETKTTSENGDAVMVMADGTVTDAGNNGNGNPVRKSIFEKEDTSQRKEDDPDWPGLRQQLDERFHPYKSFDYSPDGPDWERDSQAMLEYLLSLMPVRSPLLPLPGLI